MSMQTIAVFDPTKTDAHSAVRGIGRYVETLKDACASFSSAEQSVSYISSPKEIRKNMVLVNPFINPAEKPLFSGRKASRQIGVIHDLIPLKYPQQFPTGIWGFWHRFLLRRAVAHLDQVVTDSEASKADIVRYFKISPAKVAVVYPTLARMFLPHLDTAAESPTHHHPFHRTQTGETVAEFTPIEQSGLMQHPAIAQLPEYMIYVGDGTWNKNLPVLARAIKMTTIPCVFVGKVFALRDTPLKGKPHPWMRSLYEFFMLAKNDERFVFPGFLSDAELVSAYRRATINVLLSRDEGFGYSFIEAGSMGTPSVLADIPVFHEIAKDAADFANPLDPKAVAEKITQVFYDKIHREKMSVRAFDRAQDFRPEAFARAWKTMLVGSA